MLQTVTQGIQTHNHDWGHIFLAEYTDFEDQNKDLPQWVHNNGKMSVQL